MQIDPLYAGAGALALGLASVLLYWFERDARFYRQERSEMEFGRPPMGDAEFLRIVGAEADDEPLWRAVRLAVAQSTGLPNEAVHPHDPLALLWEMQFLGPDLLELIFLAERALGFKVPRGVVDRHVGPFRFGQHGEFADFAANFVRALKEIRAQRE